MRHVIYEGVEFLTSQENKWRWGIQFTDMSGWLVGAEGEKGMKPRSRQRRLASQFHMGTITRNECDENLSQLRSLMIMRSSLT